MAWKLAVFESVQNFELATLQWIGIRNYSEGVLTHTQLRRIRLVLECRKLYFDVSRYWDDRVSHQAQLTGGEFTLSAYQVALREHLEAREEEWLSILTLVYQSLPEYI